MVSSKVYQHKEEIEDARYNFHKSLITRGEEAQYIPIKNIIEWIESLGEGNDIEKVGSDFEKSIGKPSGEYVFFKYEGDVNDTLPPHYHDKDETFEVVEGTLIMELIIDERYAKVRLEKGDTLTIKAGSVHRGEIVHDLVANLTFKL